MRHLYLVLCVLGTVLPLAQFAPWLGEHGLDVPLLVQQTLATPVSAFAWSDVLVSALATVALVLAESRRLRMRHGWVALLGLCVGVSLALPLCLWLRECHLVRARSNRAGSDRD